jgi:hypothetical protein
MQTMSGFSGFIRYWLAALFLCLLTPGIVGCGGGWQQPGTRATPSTTISSTTPLVAEGMIMQMLDNIKTNGYNSAASVNDGMGGLWINWRYGTHPLQTNLNGSGVTDSDEGTPLRHDPLTDLRYVHALWLYKNLHREDTRFESELKRYTSIVKHEFTSPQNDRGWLYDMFIDLYRLSKDTFYQDAARDLAQYFFTHMYHPETGVIYKTSTDHPDGFYRVDLALEAGCALIQAGAVFHRPDWTGAGRHVVDAIYHTAYLTKYHLFLMQVGNVILPDGKLNPNPSIFRGKYGSTKIDGGSIKLGAVAQEILSLLHVYAITHEQAFLDRATAMLTPLSADQNLLGLWDKANGGYFAAVSFSGPDVQNAGTPGINRHSKESGRQVQMLEAYRVANSFTRNSYEAMQNLLLQITSKKIYYAPGHGVLYQETADWQPVPLKSGGQQDWVTTEAMGIALESLFSLSDPTPW